MNTKYTNPERVQDNVANAAELFAMHGDFLLKVFKKNLSEQDAYDLWQNLFLSLVFNPIPRYIPNVRGYLYRAAINDIIDFKRCLKLHKERIKEYSQVTGRNTPSSNPAKRLSDLELLKELYRQIEMNLPAAIGQAVIHKHKNNMSHRQIAEKMCIKEETVKRYLSVGTKMIKDIQEQLSGEENGQT